MNILLTNIGRRGYLVNYIKENNSLHNVYVTDCDRTASGLYSNNDGFFILPRVSDGEHVYINALQDVCRKYNINLIIPIIDPELTLLSKYKDEFLKNNINVAISNHEIVKICNDKILMNCFLQKYGFHYPKTYSKMKDFEEDLEYGRISFPVIIKPVKGSGSLNTYVVNNKDKLSALFDDGMIIQELLVGPEYGVDVFNALDCRPVRCVIKRKISMRSGETDKCVSVYDGMIRDVAIRLASNLKHICNLDCDIIVCQGNPYVLDLNPRLGGGYPATHAIGVNLVGLLVEMYAAKIMNEHYSIEQDLDNYEEGVVVMKEVSIKTTKQVFHA